MLEPAEREEMIFKYNNGDSLLKYKRVTTNTSQFTSCFSNNQPFLSKVKAWECSLNKTIYACFDKIRVKETHKHVLKTEISQLLD